MFSGGRLGETPLHIAAGVGGRDGKVCADMLLKSGAEPSVKQEVIHLTNNALLVQQLDCRTEKLLCILLRGEEIRI